MPQLTLVRTTKLSPEADCHICLEECTQEDAFSHPGAEGKHQFHADCINRWINGSAIAIPERMPVINHDTRQSTVDAQAACPACRYTIIHNTDETTLRVARVVRGPILIDEIDHVFDPTQQVNFTAGNNRNQANNNAGNPNLGNHVHENEDIYD